MKRVLACVLILMGIAGVGYGQLNVYRGTLDSINPDTRTIVVRGASISQAFVVAAEAEIVVKDKPKGALEDLRVGDSVEVSFRSVEGVNTAFRIALLGLKPS